MKNILEIATQDLDTYLDVSYKGLSKKVDFFNLDFTRGETEVAKLLFIEKDGLTFAEAQIILIQRLLMVQEEWMSPEEYTKENVAGWTEHFLKAKYNNAPYVNGISIDDDSDRYLITDNLFADRKATITFNERHLDFEEFNKENPLLNDNIIEVSKSHFKGLLIEFYFETDKHFLLYNWYTTA